MRNEIWETGKTNTMNETEAFPRPASRFLLSAFCILLVLGGVMATYPATADIGNSDTHAGIVIQFDDGSVGEYCVDLGTDGEATGEEALRATGLDVVVDYQGMGAAICKIEGDGCNFPAQDCFCECTMLPGDPCTYWAYHRLEAGTWVQSPMGSSGTILTGGSVDGWSWGTGSVSEGTEPPVRTFDQVCAAILATATPTQAPPTNTATPIPTNTATATPRPSATATVAPTNTPAPTGTLIPTVTTAGLPSATSLPSATAAATGATLPTNTRVPPTATQAVATSTPPVVASATIVTLTASPTGPVAEPTATLPPTATQPATPIGAEGTVVPTLAAPVVNAPTPTVAGIALQSTLAPVSTPIPPLVAADDEGMGDGWLYGVFALIVVGLGGIIGWVWYQQRMT
jgi:hypothetical protein